MPINWVDVPDPKNPPNGAPKLSAANLARLALIEDIGTTGTATGDAIAAAITAHGGGTGGVSVTDNGDGTASTTSTSVVDHGDGTAAA